MCPSLVSTKAAQGTRLTSDVLAVPASSLHCSRQGLRHGNLSVEIGTFICMGPPPGLSSKCFRADAFLHQQAKRAEGWEFCWLPISPGCAYVVMHRLQLASHAACSHRSRQLMPLQS